MGRLLAFLLGGLALMIYSPPLFLTEKTLDEYQGWCKDKLGDEWYGKLFGAPGAAAPAAPGAAATSKPAPASVLPGVFAGLALVLLAVRGRDHGGYGPV